MKKVSMLKRVLLAVGVCVGLISMNPQQEVKAAGWSMNRYINDDGTYRTGWLLENGSWYYLKPDTGIKVCDSLRTINGVTYYFDLDGKMFDTKVHWINSSEAIINGVHYDKITKYNDITGTTLPDFYYNLHEKNSAWTLGGKYRTFMIDPNTNEVKFGRFNINGKTYLTDKRGLLELGWITEDGRQWEYFDIGTGEKRTGYITLNGETFNLDDPKLNTYYYAPDLLFDSGMYFGRLIRNSDLDYFMSLGITEAEYYGDY